MNEKTSHRLYEADLRCQSCYDKYAPFYHSCTPENFPVIFTSDEEFKQGMNIFGLCARLFPRVIIVAVQLMSNHLHLASTGPRDEIEAMMATFSKYLARYLDGLGRSFNRGAFIPRIILAESLENLRNDISYVHRNGFVAYPDYTPFTYPWGTNIIYFNRFSKTIHNQACDFMTVRARQLLTRSHKFNDLTNLVMLDGVLSPVSFCKTDIGESVFRSARHYFYNTTKNIEGDKMIAARLGESLFYTDTDLYRLVSSMARKISGDANPAILDNDAKISLAKELKYGYNATIKQIGRLLKIDLSILNAMFPH